MYFDTCDKLRHGVPSRQWGPTCAAFRRCCLSRAQVLSVSCNRRLLLARHKLLQEAGFDVISLASTFDALNLLEDQRFAAVVVGNSFPFTERQLFAAEVGERWRIPVVMLLYRDVDVELTGDDQTRQTAAAADLICTLNSLISDQEEQSA